MKLKNLSIIICAFNEEETILDVVSACCRYNPLSEVMVVDDGSTDSTGQILKDLGKEYQFRYERLPENKGKSWAMVHGVEQATGDIILFFDADVSHITRQHFTRLLEPMKEGIADMVLGQPRETMIDYRINTFEKTSTLKATRKYISEGHEIALTYMDNYDLIVRRIENKINHAGKKTRDKVSEIQLRINREIEDFIKGLN